MEHGLLRLDVSDYCLAFCRSRFPAPSIIAEFYDKLLTDTEPVLPSKLRMSDSTSGSGFTGDFWGPFTNMVKI